LIEKARQSDIKLIYNGWSKCNKVKTEWIRPAMKNASSLSEIANELRKLVRAADPKRGHSWSVNVGMKPYFGHANLSIQYTIFLRENCIFELDQLVIRVEYMILAHFTK